MRQVLYYCQSAKLVPIIVNAGTKDRNPKLRQYCAAYLIQVAPCAVLRARRAAAAAITRPSAPLCQASRLWPAPVSPQPPPL